MKYLLALTLSLVSVTASAQIISHRPPTTGPMEILRQQGCEKQLELFRTLSEVEVVERSYCYGCGVYEITGYTAEQVRGGYAQVTYIAATSRTVNTPYGTTVGYRCYTEIRDN